VRAGPVRGRHLVGQGLARLHSDPQRPRLVKPGIPRELESITMRLLARSPDRPVARYRAATDVRAALLGAGADDRPTTGDPTITQAGSDGAGAGAAAG
jgi:hypothetical protein